MFKYSSQRGFTLIELLVVIAIIGILASVVMASLGSARSKGADASIKSTINNARAQAELFYDSQSPNSYTGVCTGAGGIIAMKTAADNTNGSTATVVCASDDDEWVLQAGLVTTGAGYYCVDHKGNAVTSVTSVAGTTGGDIDCD